VKVRAGCISAMVIVVFDSDTDFKFAHGVVATAAANNTTATFGSILF
jgi:hypothetical protein